LDYPRDGDCLMPIAGPQLPLAFDFSPRAQRDRILEALQMNHRAYLTTLRSFARIHAMRHRTVTIDDVRAEIVRQDFFMPAELKIDQRVFGTVFHCKDFELIGQIVSTRKDRVARAGTGASHITVYKLKAEG
jgi:hypothetical protein